MASAFKVKPTHKAVKSYYAAPATYADQSVEHEGAVRSAFQNLLSETGRKVGWTLIPELSLDANGHQIRPDGTFRDEFTIERGYWEAKDTDDDLEGDIQKAITYYEDPHELLGKAEFVMANPPFNVDEIDADKVKTDPRLPFGLPGVNKKEKVSNGNYVWISYFYSYLNERGRAGFVMSSQASSAGGGEAKVRQKLVENGDVGLMVAIREDIQATPAEPYTVVPGNAIAVAANSHSKRGGGPNV